MAPVYAAIDGSERVPLPGAVATGRANPHATIAVSVKLRRKRALPVLAAGLGATMTRQELSEAYGASQTDIDTVVQNFEKLGLKPAATNAATRTVELCGTVTDMEHAFGVRLFNYTHESGSYRGRVGKLHVPQALQPIVTGVFGLDNRRVARQRRLLQRENAYMRLGSMPSAWYVPSELAAHYHYPPGDGAGQTVALLEFGGGYVPADLEKFCELAKIAIPPQVIAISTDGSPTDLHDDATGEVMLDVEVIAGLCPKASIAVYFAACNEQGWITALDYAVHDQKNDPGVISISWGGAEDVGLWTMQALQQMNETLQEAAALGITVCVAAGDDGSSDAVPDGHAHVNFPASSPYVLAVGGTTITANSVHRQDIAWKEGDGLRSDNGGSTGGGVSTLFPVPAWQQGVAKPPINPGAIAGRCIPDLSANADWNASPYLLVVDGKAQPNGGTSAASPLVAGLLTLINAQRGAGKRLGYVTPVLYQLVPGEEGTTVGAAGCTDVLTGDNVTSQIGGFVAQPGYDAVSGWGTPHGTRLAAALAA